MHLHSHWLTQAHQNAIPKFDDKRHGTCAKVVLAWFDEIATDDEKAILLPPAPPATQVDEGARVRIVATLQGLIIAYLREQYVSIGLKVPRDLKVPLLTHAAHIAALMLHYTL